MSLFPDLDQQMIEERSKRAEYLYYHEGELLEYYHGLCADERSKLNFRDWLETLTYEDMKEACEG